MQKTLNNRIALITGASRGIGAAVAKRFAAEGAHVILVARNVKGLEETDDAIRANGGSATLVPMDLGDLATIELLAQNVAARFGKLDILVGNGAILGDLMPLAHLSVEEWEKVQRINVNANWQLIRCFDTLLKQSDAPRAMFVTSGVTKRSHAYWGTYATSKAALEMLVNTYAAENIKTSLRVNLIDPGVVRTRMRAQAMPGENPETLPPPDSITDAFVQLARPALQETGQKFHV